MECCTPPRAKTESSVDHSTILFCLIILGDGLCAKSSEFQSHKPTTPLLLLWNRFSYQKYYCAECEGGQPYHKSMDCSAGNALGRTGAPAPGCRTGRSTAPTFMKIGARSTSNSQFFSLTHQRAEVTEQSKSTEIQRERRHAHHIVARTN